ncbi:MAG: hypothetical protein AAFR75_05755 [Pseudomonadota bacterium]
MRIIRLVVLITLGLLSGHVCAQERADAQLALLAYFEATRTYDTVTMSSMMHPKALYRFRNTINLALRGPNSEAAESTLLPLFAVNSVSEFEALSDVEAYQRLNDVIASSVPELIAMMRDASMEIVGETHRESIVYVTYVMKMKIEGEEIEVEVVQKLKQHDGVWMLLLPSKADATIAGIEAEFF